MPGHAPSQSVASQAGHALCGQAYHRIHPFPHNKTRPTCAYVLCGPARLPACLQFAVSEDLLLLEVARQATQQVKPGALPLALGGSPGGPGGSPLLVTKGELGTGVEAGSGLAPRCRLALFAPQPSLRPARLTAACLVSNDAQEHDA